MKGEETAAQLAARYQVHPSHKAWKKALVEGAAGVFDNGNEQKPGTTPPRSSTSPGDSPTEGGAEFLGREVL